MPRPSVAVHPSGPVVPQNLLRLHVFFSEPPFVDQLTRAVRLHDSGGAVVAHAFLDLQEGLWDATGTRLTLLLHPGRIKSGLAANLANGPAFEAGRSYQLIIDLGLLFGTSEEGARVHRHEFDVGPALRTAVDESRWHIDPPASGTRQPLRLTFDRSMDRLNLEESFVVTAAGGEPVPFTLAVGPAEQEVLLEPIQPWRPGAHDIHVSAELEDVAGNRMSQAFEQSTAVANAVGGKRPGSYRFHST